MISFFTDYRHFLIEEKFGSFTIYLVIVHPPVEKFSITYVGIVSGKNLPVLLNFY